MKKMVLPCMVAVVVVMSVVSCGGPAATEKPSSPQASPEVLAARDAALTYVREHYDEAPAEGLSWTERRVTPEGLVGAETYEYAAEDWVVTVSYGVVAPEWTVYRVSVTNQSSGFEWEGRVDASGQVPEASEYALLARDAALLYVSEQYSLAGLGAGLAWREERVTPEGLLGAETFRYTAESWVVEVHYPVVAPEATVYEVTVTNRDLGLEWRGTVDDQGVVTEGAVRSDTDPVYGEASVESIDILILESFPVQVRVVAKGHLPDACTRIDQITQEHEGNTFLMTITTVRPADAVCVEKAVDFEEVIPLEVVGLPAGTYFVDVHGVIGCFELEMDNVLPEEGQ